MFHKCQHIKTELNVICGSETDAISDAIFLSFGKNCGANIGKRLNLDNFAASNGRFMPEGNGFIVECGGAVIAK